MSNDYLKNFAHSILRMNSFSDLASEIVTYINDKLINSTLEDRLRFAGQATGEVVSSR